MSNLGEQLRARISSKMKEPCLEDGPVPGPAYNAPAVVSEPGPAAVVVVSKPGPAVVSLLMKEEKVGNQNNIKSMFAKQNLKKIKRMEEGLLKEERLENKRRLEVRWKKMRTHAANLRWVREWLEDEIILPVSEKCRRMEEIARRKTALECSADILDGIVREVEVRHDCGYSPVCPGWFCVRMVEIEGQDDPKNIPTGRKKGPSTGEEQTVQRTGNGGDPGMSTSRDLYPERKVTVHPDESLAGTDINITKGQGTSNLKTYKKSIYATKKKQ